MATTQPNLRALIVHACAGGVLPVTPGLLTDTYFDQPLQEIQAKAFVTEGLFASERHILMYGPTGCGKSSLLDAFILHALTVKRRTALYLAPTRALASQFQRTFLERYRSLLNETRPDWRRKTEEHVVLSSGDNADYDHRILNGLNGLICIVTEKANIFMSDPQRSQAFLNGLGCVIVDELHMIGDEMRGGVVDQLLAKLSLLQTQRAVSDAPCRVIGVTTDTFGQDLALRRCSTTSTERPHSNLMPLCARFQPHM